MTSKLWCILCKRKSENLSHNNILHRILIWNNALIKYNVCLLCVVRIPRQLNGEDVRAWIEMNACLSC